MKPAVILIALACQARAALLATFLTTKGDVVVELQYDKAPQAVANFITLAQGTRSRMDPLTGALTRAPMYVGEKFYRVINDAGFKIAQTGSGTGTNSGGPGFTFKDEFDASLTHVPYVLSMANGGPNTNGSQIFLTGNVSIPNLNGVHTVFGIVNDPSSRTVIDSILTAGNDGTTVNGITFSRTDAAAVAFNELAQALPVIERAEGWLDVQPGISAIWNLQPFMSTGDVLNIYRSATLQQGSWSELDTSGLHVGILSPLLIPIRTSAILDGAALPSAFYQLSVARHPGSVTPSTPANHTVVVAFGNDLLSYKFNSTGSGGTAVLMSATNGNLNYTFDTLDFSSSAHSMTLVVQNNNFLSNYPYFRIKIGCDSANNVQISGHHATEYLHFLFGWQPLIRGAAAISR